ncbi:hypothetical protein HHK36_025764 [Tetracentron sinense]|uniref:Homeobox domain-containing protein n=1 Tax=Tetracentron sinense TaxID=13715 RepID=A0A834YI27_TETSI|nr:hypothetical protein HHK36_025764 [Tetracentron sinense]
MAAVPSSSHSSALFRGLAASRIETLFVGHPRSLLVLPRSNFSCSTIVFSRRKNSSSAITSKKKEKKKKSLPQNDDEDDLDEDAIEALFSQLEEDLKNDNLSADDSDEEISEEDFARLERELEEALGDDNELSEMLNSIADSIDGDDDEEEEEEIPVKLKNWQLRRLASALKIGRRKTSIKNLAAELCLDRAVVLELLREPPPDLLLMSASLPDIVVPTISEPEIKEVEPVPVETILDIAEPDPKVKVPVHVMQSRWSAQKRLKKVQVETLERVYNRTKRPTNAMISSIVHVTNLPRKKVVKWFEDKRSEDGVPDNRLAYQRSTPETVFTNQANL